MKVFFDTSVLIPALVDQLDNHPASFSVFQSYTSNGHTSFCSTHSLAEFYAVITVLPLPKRISTIEAKMLIEETIINRLQIVSIDQQDYIKAIGSVSEKELSSGIVYDALHVQAAAKSECTRIYTYNINHLRRISPDGITVTAP